MRVSIIAKTSNVRSKIAAFVKLTAKIRDEMQTLAANTLYHAAKHGDCSLLNEFYGALSAGDKASFKRWVVKEASSVYDPDVKTSDLFIGLKKDEFHIKKDTVPYRNEFTARVDDILADEAKANEYAKFFAIDPDKEKNPFDTAALLKMIESAVKRAEADKAVVAPEALIAIKELSAAFAAKVKPYIHAAPAAHQ